MTAAEHLAFRTEAFMAVALWTGLSLLLAVVLSARVVAGRKRLQVSLGDGGHDEMTVRSRTFGNAAEYMPLGLIGLAIVAVFYSAPIIHALGAAFVVGRLSHAWGLAQARQPSPGRLIGMILTYVPLVIMAGLLIFAAVS